MPKLRVRTGASVEISVVDAVPPILPLRVVSVTLPVDVLVEIVFADDPVIFPEAVCKFTDAIVVLPSVPLMAIAFVP